MSETPITPATPGISVSGDPRFVAMKAALDDFKLANMPRARTAATVGESAIIETTSDARLRDVVSLLLKHNISSCPVRRADHKGADGRWIDCYTGVVDILDIVAFVLSIVKSTAHWGKGFEAVLEAVVQFAEHTVADVIAASPVVAFQPVEENANVSDALKLLSKDRCHRAIVIDAKTERLVNIVTQSSMLDFIVSYAGSNDAVGQFVGQPIADLGLSRPQRLVCVPLSHKAVDAFGMIQRHRITGVPVVDKSGKLVGNVSARDIRSMVGSPDKFDRLFDSLGEFLVDIQVDKQAAAGGPARPLGPPKTVSPNTSPAVKPTGSPAKVPAALALGASSSSSSAAAAAASGAHESKSPSGSAAWQLPPAVTVQASDTLLTVMKLLSSRRIHRVYLVNAEGKPSGVVTMTDVLRVLSEGMGACVDNPRTSVSRAAADPALALLAAKGSTSSE